MMYLGKYRLYMDEDWLIALGRVWASTVYVYTLKFTLAILLVDISFASSFFVTMELHYLYLYLYLWVRGCTCRIIS